VKIIDIGLITYRATFESLFPKEEDVINRITRDMYDRGYNKAFPVIIANVKQGELRFLLDGHQRVIAAKKAGLKAVFFEEMTFNSERHALEYAVKVQRNRRNIKDSTIYSRIIAIDKSKAPGRIWRPEKEKGKSSEITARKAGTSSRKVEQVRTIRKRGTPELNKSVENGEKSINAAYRETIGFNALTISQKVEAIMELMRKEFKEAAALDKCDSVIIQMKIEDILKK